jgi:uncharacterized protein (DUF362 family)/Pyruvate/2-oxoacid:ferredoxin oxidoreductase delta subunit
VSPTTLRPSRPRRSKRCRKRATKTPRHEGTQVALARCSDYGAGVRPALEKALAALGGIRNFVRPGQSALVKPNLLTDAEPERAKTTHPEIVRHLLRILKEAGAKPFVADSPASVIKLDRVWDKTGFRALCAEEQVPLVNLEEGGSETVRTHGVSFTVARRVLDADVVITVPKVKTHVLTTFTGAVKNLYGCVPGLQKTALHRQYFAPQTFALLLAAIYEKVRPALAVADGVVAMHGDGPTSGDLVTLGLIAASADSVALDATLCRLVGIEPASVPHLQAVQQLGLGETRADRIPVVGDPIEPGALPRFRQPNTMAARLVPAWLVRFAGRLLWCRPAFSDRCVSCGLCVKACPAEALRIEQKGDRPRLAPRRCVACCCCHEVCPHHAIAMQLSPLFRVIRRRQQSLRS